MASSTAAGEAGSAGPAAGSSPESAGLLEGKARQLAKLLADDSSPVSIEALLDGLIALHYECHVPSHKRQKTVGEFLSRYEPYTGKLKTLRMQRSDFELVRVLGRGAFGEVRLVRHNETKEIFAMKMMSKAEMIKRSDSAMFWEERFIMSHARSPWIVPLHYAFQDDQFLYMCMEYMAGGDLVTLQENYEFPEDWVRFYTAELVMAVNAIHEMGYVHRDIKPDNVLLDMQGHLKLADFGTCIKMDAQGCVRSDTAVGTPDYISPEVLESQDGNGKYGKECDWWSVGVSVYEMLCGDTPFYSETLLGTYGKIMNHKPENLEFPDEVTISDHAKDFMRKLLARKDDRLGSGESGFKDIKAHPFFTGIEWDSIRTVVPPVVPDVADEMDASNFPDVEKPDNPPELFKPPSTFTGNQLPFIGFTFSRDGAFQVQRESSKKPSITTDKIGEKDLQKLHDALNDARAEVLQLEKEKLALEEVNRSKIKALEQELAQTRSATMLDARKAEGTAEKDLALANLEVKEMTTRMRKIEDDKHALEVALNAEIDRLKISNEDLAHRLQTAEQASTKAHQELQTNNSNCDDMRRQLSEQTVRADKLERERKVLDHEMEDLNSKVSEMRRQLDAATRAKQAAEHALEDAEDKVESLEGKRKRLEARMNELDETNGELSKKVADLRLKLNTAKRGHSLLQEELDNMDIENEKFQSKIKEQAAKIVQLQKELEESQAASASAAPLSPPTDSPERHGSKTELFDSISALKQQLKTEQTAKAALKAELEEARATEEGFRIELVKLKEAQKRTRKDSEAKVTSEANSILEELRTSLETETATRKSIQSELELIKGNYEKMESDLAKAQKKLDEEQCNNLDLCNDLDAQRTGREAAEKALHKANNANEELQSRVDELLEKTELMIETAKRQNVKLVQVTKEADELGNTRSQLQEDLAAATQKLLSLTKERDEAVEKQQEDERQLGRLKIELEHAQKSLDVETAARKELQANMQDMQGKLVQETKELQERHRESVIQLKDITSAKQTMQLEINRLEAILSSKDEEIRTLANRNREIQHLADQKEVEVRRQKVKTEEAVSKLVGFMSMKGIDPSKLNPVKQEAKRSDAEAKLKRALKQNKGYELKVSQLQNEISRLQGKHDEVLAQAAEEHSARIAGLEEEHAEKVDKLNRELERLREDLNKKTAELQRLSQTISMIQQDKKLLEVTPTKIKRQLSFVRDRFEGWLEIPKGNIKKHGWEQLYAVLTPESLSIFADQSSIDAEPRMFISIQDVHHVKPATQNDIIHAKSSDIPRIFQIVVVHVPRSRIASESTPRRPSKGKLLPPLSGSATPQLSHRTSSFGAIAVGSPSSKDGTVVFQGHEFEKQAAKKAAICSVCQKAIGWSLLKQHQYYECKHCHMVSHVKHVGAEDAMVLPCPGGFEVQNLCFMAPTEAEMRRWVSEVSTFIQRRGEVSAKQRSKADLGLKTPDVGGASGGGDESLDSIPELRAIRGNEQTPRAPDTISITSTTSNDSGSVASAGSASAPTEESRLHRHSAMHGSHNHKRASGRPRNKSPSRKDSDGGKSSRV